MRLRAFAMYGSGVTESVSLEKTSDIYLRTKERGCFRIADGRHKMPIIGEVVIQSSDSVVRRTRSACGRAETDCVQAVARRGIIALRHVTPHSADNRINPQTTWAEGG